MTLSRSKNVVCHLVLWLTLFMASTCEAAYPERPIRLIVPFAPGGGNDLIARVIAQKLSDRMSQPVIVDNRAGAGGNIGADIAAKAQPDGHTLLLISVSFVINAALQPKLPFDPLKDFSAVSRMAGAPLVLVVHPAVPAKSVSEFIVLAKSRPGQINYASSGTGSATHFAMELFMAMTGTMLTQVPYKGTGPSMVATAAGEVQSTFNSIPPSVPYIHSGRVRGLGLSSQRRFPLLPEVPTFAETGLPQYTFGSWYGILAPARTPSAIVERLNREIAAVMQLPDVREKVAGFGAEPLSGSSKDFAQYLAKDIAQWSKVVRERNIRPN